MDEWFPTDEEQKYQWGGTTMWKTCWVKGYGRKPACAANVEELSVTSFKKNLFTFLYERLRWLKRPGPLQKYLKVKGTLVLLLEKLV